MVLIAIQTRKNLIFPPNYIESRNIRKIPDTKACSAYKRKKDTVRFFGGRFPGPLFPWKKKGVKMHFHHLTTGGEKDGRRQDVTLLFLPLPPDLKHPLFPGQPRISTGGPKKQHCVLCRTITLTLSKLEQREKSPWPNQACPYGSSKFPLLTQIRSTHVSI